MEVPLLHPAILHRDVAVQREAEAEHHRPLQLGANPIRVDHQPAVYGGVDPVYPQRSVRDRDLGDRSDVGDEAVVRRDPKPVIRRQLATPTRLPRHQIDHPAQAAGVVRQGVLVGAVSVLILLPDVDDPPRSDELEQILLGIPAGQCGQLVRERSDSKAVVDVGDRAQPADARVRGRRAGLTAQVGNVERDGRAP